MLSKSKVGAVERPPAEPIRIDASAGGLEAFSALLHVLPADFAMAFLLIQHPDRKPESMLSEFLVRTFHIPVHEVMQDTPVEPNHVYVMPSECNIVVDDGRFTLIPGTAKKSNQPGISDGTFADAIIETMPQPVLILTMFSEAGRTRAWKGHD